MSVLPDVMLVHKCTISLHLPVCLRFNCNLVTRCFDAFCGRTNNASSIVIDTRRRRKRCPLFMMEITDSR